VGRAGAAGSTPAGPVMAVYDTQAEPRAERAEAVAVEVDVELRVPRGAMGDLPAGVAEVLANVDGTEVVDVGEIDGVRPSALDIYVDATGRLEGDFGDRDADAMADLVADAFGVETVHAVAIEYAHDNEDADHDYG
jgi:hypothetical protein